MGETTIAYSLNTGFFVIVDKVDQAGLYSNVYSDEDYSRDLVSSKF